MPIISRPDKPFIPENIVVHLGEPDAPAENITIDFPSYIKNVASNEIYPTWPESAIRANMYAQISFALNRVFTEWYRSKGYDFDITNSTKFDQSFNPDGDVFQNISRIGDEIFNAYVVRQNKLEPLFTAYCDGIEVTCDGLSQWGTVDLANNGYNPYSILQNYYGEDINIIKDTPIKSNFESYPLYPLRLGSFGQDVSIIQNELKRIRKNYPSIPAIDVDQSGIFGVQTEAAVKSFQQIFNLTQDGVVGPATWYKIKYIYNGVKGLTDIVTEGIDPSEIDSPFAEAWQEGDYGIWVRLLQYYIRVLGCYYDDIPLIELTSYYGPETAEAVIAIQKKFNLIVDGIVGIQTWALLDKQYKQILDKIPPDCLDNKSIYPGYILSKGMGDKNVTIMQTHLQKISEAYPEIPKVEITGYFDEKTEEAVRAIQKNFLDADVGVVGPITWSQIAVLYEDLIEKEASQQPAQ